MPRPELGVIGSIPAPINFGDTSLTGTPAFGPALSDHRHTFSSDARPSLLAVGGVFTSVSITADQHNYAPGGHDTAFHFRLITDATVRTITGLVGPSHVQGMLIVISNNNTATAITIANESSSSTGVNRFWCPNNVNFSLAPRASIMCLYDFVATRWRLISPVA